MKRILNACTEADAASPRKVLVTLSISLPEHCGACLFSSSSPGQYFCKLWRVEIGEDIPQICKDLSGIA